MIIKNGNVYQENGIFRNEDLYIQKEKIAEFSSAVPGEETIDVNGCYVLPGLVDIHFHGCVGHDFCDGTIEAITAMAEYEAKNGITSIVPATMTLPEDTLCNIFKTAAAYQNNDGAQLCGINMEGPFISLAKKGAQNSKYISKTDVSLFHKFQEYAKGLIKLVDIAPEEDGALAFIRSVKEEVVCSIAHTTADYNIACAAFEAGASHVTHLYNAMPPFTHREPGVVGAAFDHASHVELICDGIHIHPSMVRATFQMFGDDRVVLISDSMMATGMPDGEYALGGQPVMVKGNHAVLSDGTLAGSATNLADCMRVAVKEMGIPLEKAIKCASANPAKAVGIYNQCGSITPGKYANLLILDHDLNIKQVILKGKHI